RALRPPSSPQRCRGGRGMTDAALPREEEDEDHAKRPQRAVVGSQRPEEDVFGKAYDPQILRRIWAFVRPYRRQMLVAVIAVVIFTLSQLAIPLIIRHAIDHGMVPGGGDVLLWTLAVFAAVIVVNYI